MKKLSTELVDKKKPLSFFVQGTETFPIFSGPVLTRHGLCYCMYTPAEYNILFVNPVNGEAYIHTKDERITKRTLLSRAKRLAQQIVVGEMIDKAFDHKKFDDKSRIKVKRVRVRVK